MRVLIVEDEPRMCDLLREGLYECGFSVVTAEDGSIALDIASTLELDCIVLDVGLPQIDGFTVASLLRRQGNRTPMLMLTACDREDDIIHGLDCGADDYLTKPFAFAELVARLHAITRPAGTVGSGHIDLPHISIDPAQHTVMRGTERIELTRHEFLLLSELARHAGNCVARNTLMQSVWRHENVSSGTLDVLVNAVRSKIDGPFSSRLIQTVRGVGYMLLDPAAEPQQ
jgi:DNA-binding response OmpR family regulator